jgi:hypothetical protein
MVLHADLPMLSIRLVQLIETHWEEIAARLIREVKKNPETKNLARFPEAELKAWCREILENLQTLLAATKEDQMQRRFRVFGKLRFEENVPLHEAVMRLHLLKGEIFSFVHEQGFAMTMLELYREEELQVLMNRFFDACVFQVVRGYEEAWRVSDRVA